MKKYISITSVVLMTLVSCIGSRVSFTPAYNEDIVSIATVAGQKTSELYTWIESNDSSSYSDYITDYSEISNDIHHILAIDSARGNPKVLVTIAKDVNDKFSQFQNYHQQNGHLAPEQAHIYGEQMAALWTALLSAETSLNKK